MYVSKISMYLKYLINEASLVKKSPLPCSFNKVKSASKSQRSIIKAAHLCIKIGNSLVPNLLRFVVVSEQCVKTVAEFKHHLILQNLINILSYLLKPNLTYCMLARPKRPTRA